MSVLTLVLCSDTHELHEDLVMPQGDILLYAGDLSFFSRSLDAIDSFNEWLHGLPYRHRLMTLGNHELLFEQKPLLIDSLLDGATVLVNDSVEVEGLKVFGSPTTTHLGTAFGVPRSEARRQLWARVPDDTNVLLVHGPPYGVLDGMAGSDEHVGDPELLARISELRELRLVVFGHVHAAPGIVERNGVTFVNASMLGSSGSIERAPIVLRIAGP
jgi:Icc-related predicted phosphoesterase